MQKHGHTTSLLTWDALEALCLGYPSTSFACSLRNDRANHSRCGLSCCLGHGGVSVVISAASSLMCSITSFDESDKSLRLARLDMTNNVLQVTFGCTLFTSQLFFCFFEHTLKDLILLVIRLKGLNSLNLTLTIHSTHSGI